MLFSEDRINHLAHVVLRDFHQKGLAVLTDEEGRVLREIKRVITAEISKEDEAESRVRTRIPKRVMEGSAEWDVLYQKLIAEERQRSRR